MLDPKERSQILLSAEPDSWLALSEDESRVAGRGRTYSEAVKDAERNGVSDPVLIKTPRDWTPLVFLAFANPL